MSNKRFTSGFKSGRTRQWVVALMALGIGIWGTLSDWPISVPVAALTIGLYVLVFGAIPNFWMPECIIHPYFERQLPSPGSSASFRGHELAKWIDEVDEWLTEYNGTRLSKYGYAHGLSNEANDWYVPSEGIAVVDTLLTQCHEPWMSEQLRRELLEIRNSLELAATADIRFCLHMRWWGVSGHEIDVREGSYR
ncbi:MAG: hypothetical protein R3C18_23925 [Planctomycetaceae bacterium]